MSKLEHLTTSTFADAVAATVDGPPLVVDFAATWCGPCAAMAPIVEAAATQSDGSVRYAAVDIDADPGVARTADVMSVPTFVVYRDGVEAGRLVGGRSASKFAEEIGALTT